MFGPQLLCLYSDFGDNLILDEGPYYRIISSPSGDHHGFEWGHSERRDLALTCQTVVPFYKVTTVLQRLQQAE